MKFKGMTKKNLRKLVEQQFGKDMVDGKLVKMADNIADIYEGEMIKLAPHDKGYLESNTTVKTRRNGSIIRSIITFGANYAAKVHEFPPEKRGPKTRAKPGTQFGAPGPKWVERVLKGMDYAFYLRKEVAKLLKRSK